MKPHAQLMKNWPTLGGLVITSLLFRYSAGRSVGASRLLRLLLVLRPRRRDLRGRCAEPYVTPRTDSIHAPQHPAVQRAVPIHSLRFAPNIRSRTARCPERCVAAAALESTAGE